MRLFLNSASKFIFFSRRLFFALVIIAISLFGPIAIVNAAEVLHISNSGLLQIGDNNRTYTVELACLDIKPGEEDAVIELLKHNLIRGTRVNLMPKTFKDGVLVARVSRLNDKQDINQIIFNQGLATDPCSLS